MRVLEVSLRKAGFTVTTATSVQDALDKLELDAPDLIISETTFPDGDGFELRRRVRTMPDWGEIPFIFLTAEAAIENKIRGLELGVDDYLTKPIYIKEIVTRINILLQKRQRVRFEERRDGRTRFAGRVADMPVVDVIQTIEISRKSGVIQFVGERGRQAAIYFRDGRVIDAEAGTLQGEDAVYRLLTWNEGEFEVSFRTVRRREAISMGSQALLMEGMRRLDEWSRLLEQLPPLGHRFEVDAGELSLRLGDVPDEHNQLLRLLDGKRTLMEVIEASDVGDLECLQAISRLYFEELLLDIDHGAPVRHPTGRPVPLVEVETPTPIEDAASGPIDVDEPEPVRESVREPSPEPIPEALDEEAPEPEEEHPAPSLFALHDADEVRARPPFALGDDDETPAPREPLPLDDDDTTPSPEPEEELPVPGPLLGGFRPSSLRLIDEAVAAAEAIEPSMFEDGELAIGREEELAFLEDGPSKTTNGASTTNGVHATLHDATPIDELAELDSVPREIPRDEPSPPPQRSPTPSERPRVGKEDSGLRMIGSLGRDRAETSGELTAPTPRQRATTERELITILPRRRTGEVPTVSIEDLETAAAATNDLPTPTPMPMPAVQPIEHPQRELPPPAPRQLTASGVRRDAGPGLSAILLIVLAAVLAGIAVYLRLHRAKPPQQQVVAPIADASVAVTPPPAVDAAEVPPPPPPPADAAEVAVAPPADAASPPPPPVADAAVVAPKPDDTLAQARKLIQQANDALSEGDFARARELADESIALRKTARGYLVLAQALQRLGHVDEALVAVDKATQAAPNVSSVYEQKGRILWASGRKDEAREAFQKFLDMDPENPHAAQIQRLLGEPR
jgi:DNA-binding response OmpR family regulator